MKASRKDASKIDRLSYSVDEIATAHGLSASFIRLEISRGRLRAIRAGRRVLIPRASLEAYFAAAEA